MKRGEEYREYKNGFEADLHAKVIDFLNNIDEFESITIKRDDKKAIGLVKIRGKHIYF